MTELASQPLPELARIQSPDDWVWVAPEDELWNLVCSENELNGPESVDFEDGDTVEMVLEFDGEVRQ